MKGWRNESPAVLHRSSLPPLHAAVTGTVINRTTGKPQAGATVALNKLGQQNGIELIDQAKSDAQGKFTINQPVAGTAPPPHRLRRRHLQPHAAAGLADHRPHHRRLQRLEAARRRQGRAST